MAGLPLKRWLFTTGTQPDFTSGFLKIQGQKTSFGTGGFLKENVVY